MGRMYKRLLLHTHLLTKNWMYMTGKSNNIFCLYTQFWKEIKFSNDLHVQSKYDG